MGEDVVSMEAALASCQHAYAAESEESAVIETSLAAAHAMWQA